MPPTCTICSNPDRDELDLALVRGAPYRAIARQHGVGRDALARHARAGHVPVAVVVAGERHEATRAESLTERREYLWRRAGAILDAADGRPSIELGAIRELRAVVELLGKLHGSIVAQEQRPIHIKLSLGDGRPLPEWPTLPPGGEDA